MKISDGQPGHGVLGFFVYFPGFMYNSFLAGSVGKGVRQGVFMLDVFLCTKGIAASHVLDEHCNSQQNGINFAEIFGNIFVFCSRGNPPLYAESFRAPTLQPLTGTRDA